MVEEGRSRFAPLPRRNLLTPDRPASHARILAVVRRIPRGRVATYGQVAALAGLPRQPRLAGYALRHADDMVPWHRVVNAQGTISPRAQSDSVRRQQLMLQAEGIRFDGNGRLSLRKYQWRPGR
jgi:methylated-DNA-protein-cysteine methyltransferase-like protein